MLKTRQWIVPSLVLLAGTATSAPAYQAQGTQHSGPEVATNAYGAPLMTLARIPINYDEEQLDHQRQRFEAHGGAHEGYLGERCESAGALGAWKYYAFGTGIGAAGFAVSYVGAQPEVIVSGGGVSFGGNRYWYILQYDEDTEEYLQVFVSPLAGDGLRRLRVADVGEDGYPEIFVAAGDGLVEIWDQETRQVVGMFDTDSDVEDMRVVDVDQDGALEVLISTSSKVRVFALNGALEWEAPVGGERICVGQMDEDPELEIATTEGALIDAQAHQVQWTWPDGFGAMVEAADIDNDGMDELIAGHRWGWVWAFDGDTELPKWSLPIFNLGAMAVTDIDADGVQELILGEAQWGDQLAYDTTTLVLEWAINNPEHGTTNVIHGDADGDGMEEIIWGAGHSSTGPDHMFVADWSTEEHEWSNVHLDGPFRGPVRGDVDGDGTPEIVTVTNESDSGYGAGRILVFDSTDLHLEGMSQEVTNGHGWSGTWEVLLRNVDADPALEIVVGGSTTYDGQIEIYDYDGAGTFTRIWQIAGSLPDGAFRTIELIDLDGDQDLEVIGGAEDLIYVYDLDTQMLEWSSLQIAPYLVKVAVADTDDDDSLELLGLGSNGDLYIFDGTTKATEAVLFGDYTAMQTGGMMIGPDVIYLGDASGDMHTVQYDGGYGVRNVVTLGSEAIDGFTIVGGGGFLAGLAGKLTLYAAGLGTVTWTSCDYGAPFGVKTAVGKGRALAVTGGRDGLVGFSRH